jgi:hypothetical protein
MINNPVKIMLSIIIICRILWGHMAKMAAVLSEVSKEMGQISLDGYLSVKELLAVPMWKYSHTCPEQKHPKAPPTVALRGAGNYQEDFNISGKIWIGSMHMHYIISNLAPD